MLPIVEFCGLEISRLILGGNPFSGFSHQSPERDQEMLDYYTVARLKETLRRAEAAGINTTILRSDNHIHRLLREYRNEGGTIRWIAQVGAGFTDAEMRRGFQVAVNNGACAAYLHGGILDRLYAAEDADTFTQMVTDAKKLGIPIGTAGHLPAAHLWAYALDAPLDFHVVCFHNCGSLHDGKGDKFKFEDPPVAAEAIRAIEKPCIGYKIMAAGRRDARDAFEFAFTGIKPGDCVNVGMYRGDNDNMVEDNVAMVEDVIQRVGTH